MLGFVMFRKTQIETVFFVVVSIQTGETGLKSVIASQTGSNNHISEGGLPTMENLTNILKKC